MALAQDAPVTDAIQSHTAGHNQLLGFSYSLRMRAMPNMASSVTACSDAARSFITLRQRRLWSAWWRAEQLVESREVIVNPWQ